MSSSQIFGSNLFKLNNYLINMRRGQVTIFVALGLIVLIILSIFYFVRKPNEPPTRMISATTNEQVVDFLKDCIKKRTNDIFREVESNGGYASNVEVVSYGGKNVSLFLGKDGVSKVPLINDVENNLKSSIEKDQSIMSCYESIRIFKSSGFGIDFNSYGVEVSIGDGNVDFDYAQDLVLTKGVVDEIKNFRVSIKTELRNFLEISNERVNSLISNKDFELALTLRGFNGVRGEGYYTKYDGINSDYEIFKLESENNESFLFGAYDPILNADIQRNNCCISMDGMCRQNSFNCDGQSFQGDCEGFEECRLGCCSIAQGSDFKITSKNDCLVRLSTGAGNSFSAFEGVIHSDLSEDNLRQCNVEISDEGCDISVNDDNGIRNLNLGPYENGCSFRSEQDGEHYLLSCQGGVVKAEALGIDRLRVCHNNKKVFNDYQNCGACGEPSLYSDLLLYLDSSGRVVNDFQCDAASCNSLGLCNGVQSDPDIATNMDCVPLYPPNNPLFCDRCGKGGDEMANACNKDECESLGACSASKRPFVLNTLKQPSICAGLIYSSILNPNAASFLNNNCNVDSNDLFKMFSEKDTYECKKSIFSMKDCSSCVNRQNAFERCTEDSCKALNPICEFVFNGSANCVNGADEELNIMIATPSQNQAVGWNVVSVPVLLTTSKNAICRYSYDANEGFNNMLKISDDFGLSHNGNILIPYSPNDRLLRINIACIGEKSSIKTQFLALSVKEKPDGAMPLIEDINLQNKWVDVSERELSVNIDKAVLGCNFIDISDNLADDPGKINDLLNVPPPANVYPGRCNYVNAIDKSECKLDINLQPNKYYFYVVNCVDFNNVASDDLLVFFRT